MITQIVEIPPLYSIRKSTLLLPFNIYRNNFIFIRDAYPPVSNSPYLYPFSIPLNDVIV